MKKFVSKHGLHFQHTKPDPLDISQFQAGTCTGKIMMAPFSVDVLIVTNSDPDNDHLDDCFQWFEHIAMLEKKILRVVNIASVEFKAKLIEHYGFLPSKGIPNQVVKFDFL